jgi:hypothetical protein
MATASGWSQTRRSTASKKFLHLILVISGVICGLMVLLKIIGKVLTNVKYIILADRCTTTLRNMVVKLLV